MSGARARIPTGTFGATAPSGAGLGWPSAPT